LGNLELTLNFMAIRTKPPPVLAGSRVTSYAILDKSIPYAGRGNLFANGKVLGRVPRVAIASSRGEVSVFYCSRTWRVLCVVGCATMREARRSAERSYPGISRKWLRMRVTKHQIEAYLRMLWKGQECSFCNRRPEQVEKIVARRRLRICDICIREIAELMNDRNES
jgi:ClpX C4-type zinc finger